MPIRVPWLLALAFVGSCCAQSADYEEQDFASAPSAPYDVPTASSSVSPSDLYYQFNIKFQSDRVFVGNGGCSPSAVYDYLQIASVMIPTVEEEHLAFRYYKAQPSAGVNAPQINLTYFDLVNGAVIQAQSNLNFSTQQSSFNYSVLSPTVTDLTGYNRSLQSLLKLATGLANGESGNPCAPSDHKLDSAVQYLQAVAKNVSSLQNVNNGLKPTEVSLPSGCIEEIDANYEGDTVSDILTDPAGLTADDCCLKCKQNSQCNVFTYCPNYGGCKYGDNQTFPFQGCQLKHQNGNVAGPGVTPAAYSRGPPTPFASGRFSS